MGTCHSAQVFEISTLMMQSLLKYDLIKQETDCFVTVKVCQGELIHTSTDGIMKG